MIRFISIFRPKTYCFSFWYFAEGAVSLSYLFMRRKFGWTIDDYNQYVAANIIVQILGNVIGIYILSKKFGISETIIAVIAFGSSMTEYIIDGVATHTWIIYLGNYNNWYCNRFTISNRFRYIKFLLINFFTKFYMFCVLFHFLIISFQNRCFIFTLFIKHFFYQEQKK